MIETSDRRAEGCAALAAACALLLFTPAAAAAADGAGDKGEGALPFTRMQLGADDLREESHYYGIYILGHKVGWARESFELTEFEGAPAYAVGFVMEQKLLNGDDELSMSTEETEFFHTEPPFRLRAVTSVERQNGFESSTTVRQTGGAESLEYGAELRGGRAVRERKLDGVDFTLGDAFAAGPWLQSRPNVGASIRVREFSTEELEVTDARITVAEELPAQGDGSVEVCGRRGRYRMEYLDPSTNTRLLLTVDEGATMLEGRMSEAFEMRLEERDEAVAFEASIDLFAESLIRIDQPLGDPTEVRELVLEFTGPGVEAIPDGPNQDATFDAEAGTVTLRIGRAFGQRVPVTDDERAEALEETTAYPTSDPEVVALAQKAVGRATRPKARIKRLVDFVDRFVDDDYGSEPLSVNDIIDTRRGDCTEHTMLFVTLARALGIPAREVGGFIYGEDPDHTSSFGGHAWAEVEVDGHWHEVDPTWGESVLNATHIRITGHKPAPEALDLFMGGGIKVRALSAKDRNGRELVAPAGEGAAGGADTD